MISQLPLPLLRWRRLSVRVDIKKAAKVRPPVCCVYNRRADETLVAQAALNNDDRLLRIEARLSSIERHWEGLPAIQWTQQEVRAMLLGLCRHQGFNPSLHSGSSAASTHSMIPSPVAGLSSYSLDPQYSGANGDVGREDEEPSQVRPSLIHCFQELMNCQQNIGGPSSVYRSVYRGSAHVDAGPSADAPAGALPKSLVGRRRTQGSANLKEVLSGLLWELEGIQAGIAGLNGRLIRMTTKIQAIHNDLSGIS